MPCPAGNRVATCLVYLNDVAGGGETAFRDLPVACAPEKGKLLLFFPAFGGAKNAPADFRTLHAGQPAAETKMIAQVWVREREGYVPTAPAGTSYEDALGSVLG